MMAISSSRKTRMTRRNNESLVPIPTPTNWRSINSLPEKTIADQETNFWISETNPYNRL